MNYKKHSFYPLQLQAVLLAGVVALACLQSVSLLTAVLPLVIGMVVILIGRRLCGRIVKTFKLYPSSLFRQADFMKGSGLPHKTVVPQE